MTESELQVAVADYLRLRYPNVLFHSDFGSGIKLTKGQAIKQKRQNGGRRGWPDLFVAAPRFSAKSAKTIAEIKSSDNWVASEGRTIFEDELYYDIEYCAGLFIELKKDGTRLHKKDGSWATDHIAEQAETLQALRDRGYQAYFAVGFEEAKKLIDDYLGGK